VGWVVQAQAASTREGDDSPLKPIDTSSPRATLAGFIDFMDQGYAKGAGVIYKYLNSTELYLSSAELAMLQDSFGHQAAAQRVLDLSEVPPAMVHESSRRLAIQLKEVLDRLDIPPLESIPDADAMAKAEFKRWTLPNSEIRLHRVESGPRSGEYLFTPETLARLPEFYARVKNLPYKSDKSRGWYEFSSYRPLGVAYVLRHIVPPRWLLTSPETKASFLFLDQPLWRWFAIALVFGVGLVFVNACFRLSRRFAGQASYAGRWAHLLCPGGFVVALPVAAFILAEVLRISSSVYQVVTLSLWTLFYIALTWLVWSAGGAVAESLIAAENLRISSIDSQLIRLMMRLLTVVGAIAILVVGADNVGLPAYSVLAGLGVGGLAVALAAQQTLANLIGSLIIMFEKPFAVGHWVKLDGTEGTVEAVGFRSTRIRTFHNSLVTIPSSQLVNSTVDNMELREYRQVKTYLNLVYDTPVEKIEDFVNATRRILEAHPLTRKDNIQVFLHEFGPHSLDVLLNFFLKVPDRMGELAERQAIFLAILRLAEDSGVEFAFPTQTLLIEKLPQAPVNRDGA
jgi:MscS family membrane protein